MNVLDHKPAPPVPVKPSDWLQELAYEVALKYHPPEELQNQFSLSVDEYEQVTSTPHFRRAVSSYMRIIDEDAKQAKLKVKRLASTLVEEVAKMAIDTSLDPAVRLRAIENMCRYAELDRPQKNDDAALTASPFTINIQVNA